MRKNLYMKNLFIILGFLAVFAGCRGNRAVYDDRSTGARAVENLMDDYLRRPADSALANRLREAYTFRVNELNDQVARWEYASAPADKEKLLLSYQALQNLYNRVSADRRLQDLLTYTSVAAELEKTRLDVVNASYEEGLRLLGSRNWRDARAAYDDFERVEKYMPGYKDARSLRDQARAAAVVDVVVLQPSYEAFAMSGNNIYNPYNQRNYNTFSDALVRDLGGRYQGNGMVRVFSTWDANYSQVDADWTVEPVWTQLDVGTPRISRSDRRLSKQIEIGRDTLNRPIYRTANATLHVVEENYDIRGRLEMRINDYANQNEIARNSWYESENYRFQYATYSGDAAALDNYAWQLINASRGVQNRNRPNPMDNYGNYGYGAGTNMAEERLLQKMYPNVLSWLRGYLR